MEARIRSMMGRIIVMFLIKGELQVSSVRAQLDRIVENWFQLGGNYKRQTRTAGSHILPDVSRARTAKLANEMRTQ
jgi:hypothetical protein